MVVFPFPFFDLLDAEERLAGTAFNRPVSKPLAYAAEEHQMRWLAFIYCELIDEGLQVVHAFS